MATKASYEAQLQAAGEDKQVRERAMALFIGEALQQLEDLTMKVRSMQESADVAEVTAQANKMRELEDKQEHAIQRMEQQLNVMTEEFKKKMEEMQKEPGKSIGADKRVPWSRIRGADKLPHFKGVREEFEAWSTKVMTFLADEPGLRPMLLKVKRLTEKVSDKDWEEVLKDLQAKGIDMNMTDIEWFSEQLYSFLIGITHGTPYAMVKNLENEGWEAWRQLHEEYAGVTPLGKRQILKQLMSHRRAKGYEDVLAVQAEWEAIYLRYKEVAGELPEDVKITAYMNILPEKIAESTRNLDTEMDKLEKVKEYVRKQVNAHRKPQMYIEAKPPLMDIGIVEGKIRDILTSAEYNTEKYWTDEERHTDGHDECDEGCMGNLASMIKGYMGKGTGGKGGFGQKGGKGEIICNYCGRPGHVKSQCRDFDAVMQQVREKGKGKGLQGGKGDQFGGKNGGVKGTGGWNQKGYGGNAWQSSWQPWGKGGKGTSKGYGGKALYWIDDEGHGRDAPCGGDGAAFSMETESPMTDEGCGCVWSVGGPTNAAIHCSNPFNALSTDDDDNEDDDEEYPELTAQEEKKRRGRWRKMQKASQRKRKEVGDPLKMSWNQFCDVLKKDAEDAARPSDHLDRMIDALLMDDGQCNKCLNVLTEEFESSPAYSVGHGDCRGWVRVSGVVDSGAMQSVTSPAMAPHVPVRPSAGSRRGQHYVAANGSRMPNVGEQEMTIQTEQGGEAAMVFQVTDVNRPLWSVSEICDRGNRVIFGKAGGVIHNLRSGMLTPFKRENGIYIIDFWIPDDKQNSTSFPRQAR